MDTAPIELLEAEAQASLVPVREVIEGLHHMLEQEDLLEVSKDTLRALQGRYLSMREMLEDLLGSLHVTRLAINRLLESGFPDMPESEVNSDISGDIDQNLDTLTAARSKLRPITTTGVLEVSSQHAPT